jgi:hypothetical protein
VWSRTLHCTLAAKGAKVTRRPVAASKRMAAMAITVHGELHPVRTVLVWPTLTSLTRKRVGGARIADWATGGRLSSSRSMLSRTRAVPIHPTGWGGST